MLRHALRHPSATLARTFVSTRTRPPLDNDILRAFRTGDYHTAITLLSRRHPPKTIGTSTTPSLTLHEAAIHACAQIPDAAAAQTIFNAMPHPTSPAVSSVVTALCRQRDAQTALEVLRYASTAGVAIDERLLATVSRTAERARNTHVSNALSKLVTVRASKGGERITSSQNHPIPATFSNDVANSTPPRRKHSHTVRHILRAERRLRAAGACGDISAVSAIWDSLSTSSSLDDSQNYASTTPSDSLQSQVGVLSAAVDAFISCGDKGIARAIDLLLTWADLHVPPPTPSSSASQTANTPPTITPSETALLLISVNKALAAGARTLPQLALTAYDAFDDMRLPAFQRSMPLTGTYFKILQHANLPLRHTMHRIERARLHHIQLDEQAFSMAFGAILRCDARVAEKLDEGRAWMATMRSAGIPLKIQTFNIYAGQIRYCNDPQLVSSLLTDMRQAGVIPTALTYGLIFGACIVQGSYGSTARREAFPVQLSVELLEGMVRHMEGMGVAHSAYSLLALARAFAHLGRAERALAEFTRFREMVEGRGEDVLGHGVMRNAVTQMLYCLAHCRDTSGQALEVVHAFFGEMCDGGVTPTGDMLDSLLVASVRMGKAREAVETCKVFLEGGYDTGVRLQGMKHLLKAHTELQNVALWGKTRAIVDANVHLLNAPELNSTLQAVIVQFARCGKRDVCEEIMSLGNIKVAGLEHVFQGREFSHFRGRPFVKQAVKQQAAKEDGVGVRGHHSATSTVRGTSVPSFNGEPVVPAL